MLKTSIQLSVGEVPLYITKRRSSRKLMLRLKNPASLSLSIPYRTSYQEGINFVLSHDAWVQKFKEHFHLTPFTPYYLGQPVAIQYSEPVIGKRKTNMSFFPDRMVLEVAESVTSTSIEEAFPNILRKLAPAVIEPIVKEVAELTGFNYAEIGYKKMSRKLGYCTAKGKILFSTLLIQYSLPIVRYVVIHEFCHLKQLNHSAKFWELVAQFCPEYKTYTGQIKKGRFGL